MMTARTNTPVKLYRLTEVTEPGTLEPGRYIATRGDLILLDVELDEPTRPRDLIPLVQAGNDG